MWPDEELLEVGRRRGSRWFRLAAVAAAVVAVAGLGRVATQQHAPTPGQSSREPAPNTPVVAGPAHGSSHDAAPAAGDASVVEAVSFRRHAWVLQAGQLTGIAIGGSADRTVGLPRVGSAAVTGTWRLVLDRRRSVLWAVLEGARPGWAVEYRLRTLARLRILRLPAVNGAAALHGHLYLTTRNRLIDVTPRGAVRATRLHAGCPG